MELKDNLARIRELSETLYSVPFRETVKGVEIKDADNGKKAVMHYIHKDLDCAITIVDVEGNFLHQNHFHQECEIIVLLKGCAIRVCEGKEIELTPYVPVVFGPLEHHSIYYPQPSKVLAITIPASRHFPNPDTDAAPR